MKKGNLKMRKNGQFMLLSVFVALFSFAGLSGKDKAKVAKNAPVFSSFVYQGNDKVYTDNPLKADEFLQPYFARMLPRPKFHPQRR